MHKYLTSNLVNLYIRYKFSKFLSMKHSNLKIFNYDHYSVQVLPALEDNFMYIINPNDSHNAFVVDPVDPTLVQATLNDRKLKLSGILTTHHHWDHAGGNDEMIKLYPNTKIYGGDDRVNQLTDKVKQGDKLHLDKLEFECLFTPCHTSGHICYYLKDGSTPSVFTGDTLFIGGCGRFFEGTAQQMYKALVEILGKLPDKTQVFCGHEYSVSNLKYGLHVEPHNEMIVKQLSTYKKLRGEEEPTVPSTIGLEKEINPFMRVNEESVQKHCKVQDPIKAMDALRNEKNNFKG